MEKKTEKKKKGFIGWLAGLVKKCFIIFVPGMILAVALFMAINAALGPTSTPEFCGTLCHTSMDPAYQSWKKGAHFGKETAVKVGCVECHLPPKDKFFSHLFAKAKTGAVDAYKQFTMDPNDFDPKKTSKVVAKHFKDETCLRCHNNLEADELRGHIHAEIFEAKEKGEEVEKCIDCHSDAIHVRN